MAAQLKKTVVRFVKERDTKNTIRFNEVVAKDGDPTVIGTLYVQKFAHQELGSPESLSITIEAA